MKSAHSQEGQGTGRAVYCVLQAEQQSGHDSLDLLIIDIERRVTWRERYTEGEREAGNVHSTTNSMCV